MIPEISFTPFSFLDMYFWSAKIILLAVALFLTVVIPGWILIWITNTVMDKWNRTKYRGIK